MKLADRFDAARRPTIAIVGGGFSGAAVAYHLARDGADADIVIYEPRAMLGAGLAYADADPAHRINVPAKRMSLLPDDPDHFVRWLEAASELDGDPDAFGAAKPIPPARSSAATSTSTFDRTSRPAGSVTSRRGSPRRRNLRPAGSSATRAARKDPPTFW